MTDWFIPHSWLAAISGKGLLYPCAGNDLAEPIEIFGSYVDDFVFSDIHYSQGMKLGPVSRIEFKREYSRIEGDQDAVMEERRHGNLCFRYLEPSVLVERYVREIDGRVITVKRRRGFGQYAIQEQPERSLGIFLHRGDSPGESGSNVYFLANKTARHGPCARLLEKIENKLADQAIVLSDGSNTQLRYLKVFHRSNVLGRDAWSTMKEESFSTASFGWECIGYVGSRHGPTLAWGLTRITG